MMDRKNVYSWECSYLQIEPIENLVYEMNDPKRNLLFWKLMLVLFCMLALCLYIVTLPYLWHTGAIHL